MALIDGYLKISGRPVPGAEADLVNSETDARVDSDITDRYGYYRFEDVSSGTYRIEFYGGGAKKSDWVEEVTIPAPPTPVPKVFLFCDYVKNCKTQDGAPNSNTGYLTFKTGAVVILESTVHTIVGFTDGINNDVFMPHSSPSGTYYVYWDENDTPTRYWYTTDINQAVAGDRRLIATWSYEGGEWILKYNSFFGTIIDGDHIVTGTIDCSLVNISTDPDGVGPRVEIDGEGLKSYSDETTIKAIVGKLNSDWGGWFNVGGFGGADYGNRVVTIGSNGLAVIGGAGIAVTTGTITAGASGEIVIDGPAVKVNVGPNLYLDGSPSKVVAGSLEIRGSTSQIYYDATHYIDFSGTLDWLHFSDNFKVNSDGYITAKGGGSIADWVLLGSTLQAGAPDMILDAGNKKIIVGPNGEIEIDGIGKKITIGDETPNIIIDGFNKQIGTSNFISGNIGWRVEEDGSAEFNNILARGELHASIFVVDETHATGGTLLISTGLKLHEAVTTPASLDLDFNIICDDPPSGAAQRFFPNEFLRAKTLCATGVEDVWMLVNDKDDGGFTDGYKDNGDGTGTYNVKLKHGGTSIVLPAGTAVVKYGDSSSYNMLLTTDLSNSPYLDIFAIGSTPWDGTSVNSRLGNLAGISELSGWGLASKKIYLGNNLSDPNIILDGTTQKISINDSTFGNQGIQLDYNSGTPRAYIGDGGITETDRFFEFDGVDIFWRGVNTYLTKAGEFGASNAVITGTITANTGHIGGADGWEIAAKKLIGAADSLIESGILQSSDWGASAGSQLDLVNKTLTFGGSTDYKFKVLADGTCYADEIRSDGNIYLDESASQYYSKLYYHGTDAYISFGSIADHFVFSHGIMLNLTSPKVIFHNSANYLQWDNANNKFIFSQNVDLGGYDLFASDFKAADFVYIDYNANFATPHLYFHGTDAHLDWDNTNTQFEFSHKLDVPEVWSDGLAVAVTTKTANYTATSSDSTVLCNASGGAFTITLPTAVGIAGRMYTFKKTDSSANHILVDPYGAEKIDGESNGDLSTQYQFMTIVPDGANWFCIAGTVT